MARIKYSAEQIIGNLREAAIMALSHPPGHAIWQAMIPLVSS